MLGGIGASVTVAGCDAPARLASLPEKLRGVASFEGLPPDTRFVLDGSDDEPLARMALAALKRELAYARKSGLDDLPPAAFLALSGGGENGAYGAGLLTGWSALGTRPEFKAVTGVSTGALMAPFAFLGPSYDPQLEHFYTSIGANDVMARRGILAALFGESLFDSAPLLRLIRSVLTKEMIAAIGHEYSEKGRILGVATTNLDLPAGVLWNIGAIAASGRHDASELIARILLASASIPGIFPPVMIDLKAGGQRFQEMHVDGGTIAQVVLYPASLGGAEFLGNDASEARHLRRAIERRNHSLYIIRNSRIGADFETVGRSALRIAERALSTLINTQGVGDLFQLYVVAMRDGMDYNATWIPASFTERSSRPFDTAFMNKLYQVGRAAIANGTAWSKHPPGFNPTPLSQIKSPAAG
jgi:predicted acylesterase/phospholipase RssA